MNPTLILPDTNFINMSDFDDFILVPVIQVQYNSTLANVKYEGSGKSHWVGVEGIDTVDGKDYLIISPTSINDKATSKRKGQGWIQKDDGKILVPVEKTTEYINFTWKNAI